MQKTTIVHPLNHNSLSLPHFLQKNYTSIYFRKKLSLISQKDSMQFEKSDGNLTETFDIR